MAKLLPCSIWMCISYSSEITSTNSSLNVYVCGRRKDGDSEKIRKAISVNILVTKDPDIFMAQGSFGIHSSTCSNCISDSEMRNKGCKKWTDVSILLHIHDDGNQDGLSAGHFHLRGPWWQTFFSCLLGSLLPLDSCLRERYGPS